RGRPEMTKVKRQKTQGITYRGSTYVSGYASGLPILRQQHHSHSIVPGGLEVMSYTTRFTPLTSLTIRFEIALRTGLGKSTQSAVIPSSEYTARTAQV